MVAPVVWFADLSDEWMFSLRYFETIGSVIVILGFCAIFEKDIFRSFFPASKGGMKNNTIKDFFIGVLFGFVMNVGCILVAWLHGDLHFYVGAFKPVYLLVTFLCVCVQSSSEEMLTRGYIYGAHAERYPAWFAILANSLLFGILHLGNEGVTWISFLDLVLSGISLSLVVYARKSIWLAFGCHTMWNFTQSILFGLPNSGNVSAGSFLHLEAASDSFCYDTVFGVEGTIIAVLSEFIPIIWCIWLIKKDKDKAKLQTAAN